jgi:hypothetical protein
MLAARTGESIVPSCALRPAELQKEIHGLLLALKFRSIGLHGHVEEQMLASALALKRRRPAGSEGPPRVAVALRSAYSWRPCPVEPRSVSSCRAQLAVYVDTTYYQK